jgi:hypothetical protein
MVEDLEKPIPTTLGRIHVGDSRQQRSRRFGPFDLCVTSPPYLNSFDYSDVYRPELFLGKFVDSNEALRRIRMSTVRSHVQVSWSEPTMDSFGVLYRDRIDRLRGVSHELWSRRIPMMVQAYFEDMCQTEFLSLVYRFDLSLRRNRDSC